MLIKVFGIWLMVSNINHLNDDVSDDKTCRIYMNATNQYYEYFPIENTPCDSVAAEINRQIKESKQDERKAKAESGNGTK